MNKQEACSLLHICLSLPVKHLAIIKNAYIKRTPNNLPRKSSTLKFPEMEFLASATMKISLPIDHISKINGCAYNKYHTMLH